MVEDDVLPDCEPSSAAGEALKEAAAEAHAVAETMETKEEAHETRESRKLLSQVEKRHQWRKGRQRPPVEQLETT